LEQGSFNIIHVSDHRIIEAHADEGQLEHVLFWRQLTLASLAFQKERSAAGSQDLQIEHTGKGAGSLHQLCRLVATVSAVRDCKTDTIAKGETQIAHNGFLEASFDLSDAHAGPNLPHGNRQVKPNSTAFFLADRKFFLSGLTKSTVKYILVFA
jgi:hypothetical protein